MTNCNQSKKLTEHACLSKLARQALFRVEYIGQNGIPIEITFFFTAIRKKSMPTLIQKASTGEERGRERETNAALGRTVVGKKIIIDVDTSSVSCTEAEGSCLHIRKHWIKYKHS